MKSQVGVVGLGIMGTGLSRNLGRQGYALSVFNRHVKDVEENVATLAIESYEELKSAQGFDDLSSFVNSLDTPRIIMLMVNAGNATSETITSLVPMLDKGDVLIDGGNAHYLDTAARESALSQIGIHFLGCGISGGVEGALYGPSIMPGGSLRGYEIASPILKSIAAKDLNGEPCCRYIGPGGAGHFAKMVHNGIEYAEMQLLAEVYSLLRWAVGLTPDHIAEVLSGWTKTEAASYLVDITLNILRQKEDDQWVIDSILDSAGNKGTGGWAVQAAASFGIPAMMITASLHARYLSGQRHIRIHLDEITRVQSKKNSSLGTTDLFNAYQLSRLINYHEGFSIIRAASATYSWDIDLSALSAVWTNGCIIRSAIMNQFTTLWATWNDELILHPYIKGLITSGWSSLRRINQVASSETLFTPCLVAASQYISGASLRYPSANLIQAQRDYFGFHGFKKIGDRSDSVYHFPWKKD
ncbi:MAG TPA: NADP-dependent phosphogluconate dehydrogenase [Saprospiraceae bacterium]|nr:NADP-dependent phosphogluconate dehydrogenase [Saprospiraceae bacterium]